MKVYTVSDGIITTVHLNLESATKVYYRMVNLMLHEGYEATVKSEQHADFKQCVMKNDNSFSKRSVILNQCKVIED